MIPPRISFDVAAPGPAPDPNRMDIALFVGLLPLVLGGAAARQALADRLADTGWAGRADATLTDVPVRVRSLEEAEALFDLRGRLDRTAVVRGLGLPPTVEIPPDQTAMTVNVDGDDRSVTFSAGSHDRVALRDALDATLTGVQVSLGTEAGNGKAGLVFTRTAPGAGGVTVLANAALGFPIAARDSTGVAATPMGVALRGFFAQGGAEAVIVRMGAPAPLFATEAERVAALQALIPGFGPGEGTLLALSTAPLPAQPGAYPPRDPWHGLAHLHGLEDVALVLMPDLAELVSTVPGAEAQPAKEIRPPARFLPCGEDAETSYDGQVNPGEPARADAVGLELWSRLAAWLAAETRRITPEAMAILGAPLPADTRPETLLRLAREGTGAHALSHPQLQVVAPWAVSPHAAGLPAHAAPADGLVAGAIAASTLARGAWRTVAGTPLPGVSDLLGETPLVTPATAPQLTLLGRGPDGIRILSDRTTDPAEYAQANIRRLTGLILRAARYRGEGMVFEPNGDRLWRDTRAALVGLMRRLHAAGALAGTAEGDAFTVRCGPQTMTQADVDAGRVIAEIGFRPAHSLEFIEIVFDSSSGTLNVRAAA